MDLDEHDKKICIESAKSYVHTKLSSIFFYVIPKERRDYFSLMGEDSLKTMRNHNKIHGKYTGDFQDVSKFFESKLNDKITTHLYCMDASKKICHEFMELYDNKSLNHVTGVVITSDGQTVVLHVFLEEPEVSSTTLSFCSVIQKLKMAERHEILQKFKNMVDEKLSFQGSLD